MTFIFQKSLPKQSPLRAAITNTYNLDESACVRACIEKLDLLHAHQQDIEKIARDLVETVRKSDVEKNSVDALITHFQLSSEEGIVLMCLAEALLRIPDQATEDLLIKDKLTSANWKKYFGMSQSTFVNLMTRGLALSGKILSAPNSAHFFQKIWHGLLNRVGEPVIREAVRYTMKLLSENFILGRTMEEALKRSQPLAKKGYWFSYDMLGEMARTMAQADRYFSEYQAAIAAFSNSAANSKNSVSIKLSALHPRYEFSQQETVLPFLIDRFKTLALQAKNAGVSLTMDAEEANRLDMSLDIFEAVFSDPELNGWEGLGLAVQAYQKRAYAVIEWLIDLSRQYHKKIPVRLVKGAYWDSEIKWAQVGGFAGYPVLTRKSATDVNYLACATLLLSSPDAIYAQFATHNAHTVAAILWMTQGKSLPFEFQNLQGMGKALHDVLLSEKYSAHSRIYAPVGEHRDLLPYLVRRLLENGANTSFVHQIADPNTPIESLIKSPLEKLSGLTDFASPHIPLPKNIYSDRKNSAGFDFSKIDDTQKFMSELAKFETHGWQATPFHRTLDENIAARSIYNPNDHRDVAGQVQTASLEDVKEAFSTAENAFFEWDQLGADARSVILEKMGDLLEQATAELTVLLIREGGKTLPDAIAEVREAADFCRYYALCARKILSPVALSGPTGESNVLLMQGRGVMTCISPWNFPLAIFTGQVAASLVAGNCVLAKPAAQTPLIAAKIIELFYQAGVPKNVLQLLPGSGSKIGQAIIEDERIAGVLFTGSTETAKNIERTLAARKGAIAPFIAETGGMNAMFIDSSALLEQVVVDVMQSAFGSAGQRCSALRVALVQNDVADDFIAMLKGAMQTWRVSHSAYLSTDVGPVIDAGAQKMLQTYIDDMRKKVKVIAEMNLPPESQQGTFVAPIAFELPDLSLFQKEVFGPVLHVVRYAREKLHDMIQQMNALGYGLTFGIQTRIQETMLDIQQHIKTGNIYVNRNMIGAVVGVQPFGGCGLSGTGPKAGGPHYLIRLCRETTVTVNTTAVGGNTELLAAGDN